MLSHYFITTIRIIKKNKLSFFINLIGLSLAFASAFIISSYVLKETRYDCFHLKKDKIARVLCDNLSVNWTSPKVPYVIKEHIDNSIPIVEKTCLINYLYMAKVKQSEEYTSFKGLHACTPEFFEIFDCEVLFGNPDNIFGQLNSLVITRKTAEKYFPDENPVGRIMEIKIGSEIYQLNIDAVIEDFPDNSSFKFNALCNINISVKNFEKKSGSKDFKTSWQSNFCKMFLLLKDKNPKIFQTAWDQFENEHNLAEHEVHFHIQPLTDIHLNSEQIVNDKGHGNKTYIYLFSSIAFVILLVATFNYIILSVSISKTRYKEIGVKMVLGSHSSSIRKQFLIESIFHTVITFPTAYLLAYWSVDLLNHLFNISLEINIFKNLDQFLVFPLLLILIGLISGSCISFYLSRLNPLVIVKSKLEYTNKKISFQYLMLLFQIVVFTGLAGASFSIYKQIDFLKNANLGINYKNKLNVNIYGSELNHISYQTICKIVSDIPEVSDYSLGFFMPPQNSRLIQTATFPEDRTKKINYEDEYISFRFLDFFDIKCIQGRFFNSKFRSDSSKLILNESAVKLFGCENPIGKYIHEKEIIGIIKDFHTHSLHEGVAPTSYSLIPPSYVKEIAVEYIEGHADACIEKLKQELTKLNPDVPIEISLTEDLIKDMYSNDSNLNNIITYFSLFAIIIALFGLFGQSLLAVKQQIREIGIRKVYGATYRDILLHILRKYLLLCIIANMISWPIVYFFMEKWQAGFVYKSPLNIWLIVFTLGTSILVVLGIVTINVWKTTHTNPVDVLKYE